MIVSSSYQPLPARVEGSRPRREGTQGNPPRRPPAGPSGKLFPLYKNMNENPAGLLLCSFIDSSVGLFLQQRADTRHRKHWKQNIKKTLKEHLKDKEKKPKTSKEIVEESNRAGRLLFNSNI